LNAIELGNRIRARREYLNLSQQEVADALDMSVKGYGHYERGRSEPSPSSLAILAEIFKVPVSYFFGNDEEVDGPTISTFYDGLPPAKRAVADEVIRALWLENQRAETTHGKKAE